MPGYQTRQQQVAIRGADSLLIRSLLDRQQYADPDGRAEAAGFSSATWPLFGMLWPSGLQLAAHMAARPLKAGERILEVGCGLALASLVCHRRGIDVTASDAHPLAPDFLHDNLSLNALAPLVYRRGDWLEVEIKSDMLFASGSAAPRPEAVAAVTRVAEVLRDAPNLIRIEGHTDNVPIATALFPSNWELSAARAASIARVLIGTGLAPRRVTVVG